jgi:t-SNARE complex subunit (syntaxin)
VIQEELDEESKSRISTNSLQPLTMQKQLVS